MQNKDIAEAITKLRDLRRTYSQLLNNLLTSAQDSDKYIVEDLLRIVGHLQCAYDHLLASRAHDDDDYYCVVAKHLPAALILAGEIGIEVGPIYSILSKLTNGLIQPCMACEGDKNAR